MIGINRVKTWVLIAAMGGLFVLIGGVLGGTGGGAIAIVLALVFYFPLDSFLGTLAGRAARGARARALARGEPRHPRLLDRGRHRDEHHVPREVRVLLRRGRRPRRQRPGAALRVDPGAARGRDHPDGRVPVSGAPGRRVRRAALARS